MSASRANYIEVRESEVVIFEAALIYSHAKSQRVRCGNMLGDSKLSFIITSGNKCGLT